MKGHYLKDIRLFKKNAEKFEIDQEILDWKREHISKCKSRAFDGAQFKYEFIPTSIVEIQTVKCMCCDKEKTVYID